MALAHSDAFEVARALEVGDARPRRWRARCARSAAGDRRRRRRRRRARSGSPRARAIASASVRGDARQIDAGVGVAREGRARIELALDAVEARGEQRGVGEIRDSRRRPESGTRRAATGRCPRRGSPAVRLSTLQAMPRRREGALRVALVGVHGGREEPGRAPARARAGRRGSGGRAASRSRPSGERRALAVPEAHVHVTDAAGVALVPLRHERQRASLRRRDLLGRRACRARGDRPSRAPPRSAG